MDSVAPIERTVEIRCQDKFSDVIDEFRLDDPIGQDQVKIEGSKLLVPENYSSKIVLDVLPRGDKFEKQRVEFLLNNVQENVYTVVLEPVQYKLVFRIGNTDYEATETMNPSTARSKWGAYDYEINNTNRTIFIRVYGKPVMKVNHEPIHTVVERPSIFRNIKKHFSGGRQWLLWLILLLLGYGIYAGVSKYIYEKTPWPFKAKAILETGAQLDAQLDAQAEAQTEVQAEAQDEIQVTSPQAEEELSDVAPEAISTEPTVNLMQLHDIDYLKREKRWVEDSLRSPEYKALFSALKEGDVDKVIQLKETLFDSVNIQKDFNKVVDGLSKFKANDDQKKLSTSKSEMIRLSKHGSFEIGELSYSISLIDKRN